MFVKKSTAKALEDEIKRLSNVIQNNDDHIGNLETAIAVRTKETRELAEQLKTAQDRIDELESGILEKSDHTSATLHISDDLETVTPVTKVRPETITKLVEKKYLPYNKQDDNFSVNLAAMLVAYEALEQIIFSFEEALRENVEFEGGEGDEE